MLVITQHRHRQHLRLGQTAIRAPAHEFRRVTGVVESRLPGVAANSDVFQIAPQRSLQAAIDAFRHGIDIGHVGIPAHQITPGKETGSEHLPASELKRSYSGRPSNTFGNALGNSIVGAIQQADFDGNLSNLSGGAREAYDNVIDRGYTPQQALVYAQDFQGIESPISRQSAGSPSISALTAADLAVDLSGLAGGAATMSFNIAPATIAANGVVTQLNAIQSAGSSSGGLEFTVVGNKVAASQADYDALYGITGSDTAAYERPQVNSAFYGSRDFSAYSGPVAMPAGESPPKSQAGGPKLEVDDTVGAGLSLYSEIVEEVATRQGLRGGLLSVGSNVINLPGAAGAAIDLAQTAAAAANGDTRETLIQGGGALGGTAGSVGGGIAVGLAINGLSKAGLVVPTPVTIGLGLAGTVVGGLILTYYGKQAGDVAADALGAPKKKE